MSLSFLCRRQVTLMVAVLGMTACDLGPRSAVDPKATVHVTGSVSTVGGAPLAHAPVSLGAGVPDDDVAIGVFTGGFACLTGICSGRVAHATTDAGGDFVFTEKGSDTQGSLGRAKSELLSASAPPTGDQVSGPSASARFYIQAVQVAAPPLVLIDPALKLVSRGTRAALTWKAVSPRVDTVTFNGSGSGSEPVWLATVHGGSDALDARVLEDAAGRVTLSGGSSAPIVGGTASLRWVGPGQAFVGGVGAPPTRGAACSFSRPDDPIPVSQTPCQLTDGDLTSPATIPQVCLPKPLAAAPAESVGAMPSSLQAPSDCVTPSAVTFAVPVSSHADFLVARGCEATCAVSVSADGKRFTRAGAVSGDDATLALTAKKISAVRLGISEDSELREVSVWGPVSGPALAMPTDAVVARARAPFVAATAGPTVHHRLRDGLLIAIGALVLVAAAIGFGVAIGRRQA